MKCEVCGIGNRHEQFVRYDLSIGDRIVIIDGTPASVCDQCGETSFAPAVVAELQKTVWEQREPVRKLEAAVYEFSR